MSFKIATAKWLEGREEAKLKFSKEFEDECIIFRLDCLTDIIYEARLRYKEEIEKYKKLPNSEIVLALLGLPDDAP